ncbi:MAG TPA: hypothetical protein VJR67_01150 [Candidatus Nitrosopolaris sp.]|nr:hypothetical protein [Candidatus Nitrosopolaris sp.]
MSSKNSRNMDKPMLLLLALTISGVTIGVSLLTVNLAVAVSTVTTRSGPVVQEQVSTGNPTLDKEINKFYSCISKTHQDPPTKQIVDNCYYQSSIQGISGSGTSSSNVGIRSTTKPPTPPPGVLVEVS